MAPFRQKMLHRAATGVALAILTSACGEPAAPSSELTGEFELVSVDGTQLPFVIYPPPVSGPVLTGSRITFLSRGRLLDVRTYQEADVQYADTSVATYSVVDDRLIVHRPLPAPQISYDDTASLTGNTPSLCAGSPHKFSFEPHNLLYARR